MMEVFTNALQIIGSVMEAGERTHPANDWVTRPWEYHVGRAEDHLRLLAEGDQQQDHLSHAATRLLMALTLREVS